MDKVAHRHIFIGGVFIFLIFLNLPALSQPTTFQDSIYTRVFSQPDVELQLDEIFNLSWELRKSHPQFALSLAEEGLQMARINRMPGYERKMLSRIASCYYAQYQLVPAINYLDSSLVIARSLEDPKIEALVQFNMAMYQEYAANYSVALEANLAALTLYEELDMKKELAESYVQMGNIYVGAGFKDLAESAYQQALEMAAMLKDTFLMINNLQTLGILRIGMAQEEGVSFEAGRKDLKEAEKLAQKIGSNFVLRGIQNNLGLSYFREQNCRQALVYYEMALNLSFQHGLMADKLYANLSENYARCLLEMNQLAEAERWTDTALNLAQTLKSPPTLVALYELKSKVSERREKYEEALSFQKQYNILSDALRNQDQNREITNIQTNHTLEQQALQLEKVEIQRERAQYGLVALVLLFSLLSLIGFIFFRRFRRRQREKQRHLLEQVEEGKRQVLDWAKKSELGSLAKVIEGQEIERRRISAELHDGIGGTMAALKMTFSSLQKKIQSDNTSDNTYRKAMNLLDTAMQDVRSLSHQMAAKPLSHAGLKEAVRELATLLSEAKAFDLNLDIGEMQEIALSPDMQLHVYRIIQEHFQNIIKHSEATLASLSIQTRNEVLRIEIKDNGKGFDYQAGMPLPGLGLQNIEKRVMQLNGRWSLQAAKGKGMRSLIEVPLEN